MNRLYLFALALFITGCNMVTNHQSGKERLKAINDYNKYIFGLKVIDSKSILDSLSKLSDNILTDTATYVRTPKATLFVNNKAGTVDQIFEDPKGTITAMSYKREGKRIYAAEYYDNGLVMCKFNVTDNGIRQGNDTCYYENGTLRHTGFYKDNSEVLDSSKDYPEK